MHTTTHLAPVAPVRRVPAVILGSVLVVIAVALALAAWKAAS
jgi:hypothetical protein